MSNSIWNRKRNYQIPDDLTHSSGTISAVFGTTTYNVNLSGLSANTLYYLYIRKVSGVSTLVFVTTAPSTYRLSFSDAVLIGAFYANGLSSVGFGSFVSIEGTPQSEVFNFQGSGNWTNTLYTSRLKRNGDKAEIEYTLAFIGVPASGILAVNLPTNLTMVNNKLSSTTGFNFDSNIDGKAKMLVGSAYEGLVLRNSDTSVVLSYLDVDANEAFVTPTLPGSFSTTGHYIHITANIPISGWSNKPLKDL